MEIRSWVFHVFLLCWLGGHGSAWRYGCGLFSSLCSAVERCDFSTPLGKCTALEDKSEAIHQKVEDRHLPLPGAGSPIGIDHLSYDGYDHNRRSRTRTRQSASQTTHDDRMKRDVEDGKKYVYVIFDLGSCESCSDEMTDSMAHDFTEKLAKHMGMPQSLFVEVSGSGNVITFSIGQNEHDLQSANLADKISESRSDVQHVTGFVITKVGTSSKSSSEMTGDSEEKQTLNDIFALFAYICASVIIVTVLVAVLILVVKKRTSGRMKNGFPKTMFLYRQDDSHQYENLCRTHYQEVNKSQLGIMGTTQEKQNVTKLHTGRPLECDEEPAVGHMDVTIGHLVLSYLEEYQTNTDKIDCEWQELCNYQSDGCSMDVALRPENKEKNRYYDILPYDHSRVILDASNNKANSDYINATYIYDDNPWKPLYVATQGPLAGTVYDFWQMVWETGCTSIVMLTECFSVGQPQCHQYWPDDGSATYHIYEVHHASEHLLFHDYVVRDFYLKNLKTSESRTVTQFHFRSWPSLGVPQQIAPLLEFRRRVNRSFTGQDSPIIVHGSAGIGRTGTYILIDMVLRGIEKTGSKIKQIDLAATVEHLRDQRMQMVKTKDQFEFALKALAEEVQAILRAMPSVGVVQGTLTDKE